MPGEAATTNLHRKQKLLDNSLVPGQFKMLGVSARLLLPVCVLCIELQLTFGYPQQSVVKDQEIIVVKNPLPGTLNSSASTENIHRSTNATIDCENESALYAQDALIFAVPLAPSLGEANRSDAILIKQQASDAVIENETMGEMSPEKDLRAQEQQNHKVPRINMSAFLGLIPTEEVQRIAANYYRNDAEVQRAVAFLRSRDFTHLQRHILAIPELAAFLRYLNSSGFDMVGFVTALTNVPGNSTTAASLNTISIDLEPTTAAPTTTSTTTTTVAALGNEIDRTQFSTMATRASQATTTKQLTSSVPGAAAAAAQQSTVMPFTEAPTTPKEQLNGLHGLVDSVLDVLPQDQVLSTFFDKLESDEQFAKLIESFSHPMFAKILHDMQNSIALRNLIFTLHNNGIYLTRIVDSLKAYFFLGTF